MSLVTSSEFLKIFAWALVAFTMPLTLLFGFPGIFYGFGLSLLFTPVIMLVASGLGKMAGKLYSGSSEAVTEHELVLIALEKVKVLLGRQEYDQALQLINELVKKDEEIPAVHYLRAHILWEGYRDRERAISSLGKVIASTEPGNDYYRWAMNFREELLTQAQRKEHGGG